MFLYQHGVAGRPHGYYTFTPNRFSGGKHFFAIDDELLTMLINAHRQLGILQGMSRLLPNVEAIENLFLYKESMLSCHIDQIAASSANILNPSVTPKSSLPIRRYVAAIKAGIDAIKKSGYTNDILWDSHRILLSDDATAENVGHFRMTQTIWHNYTVEGQPNYNPTPPEKLADAMDDLEKYISRKGDLDPLIKMALMHFQFVSIHPFVAGNGRIGRIISLLLLIDYNTLDRSLLYLSSSLFADKEKYYAMIDKMQKWGDYKEWVKYYINTNVNNFRKNREEKAEKA